MRHLPLFALLFLMSCSTSKVTKHEFQNVYFVKIESENSDVYERSLWNMSYLYRFEDCRKYDSFPNLIRFHVEDEKAEQVYTCFLPDAYERSAMENIAKDLCRGKVADVNRNFCHETLHFKYLPGIPLE